MRSRQSCGVSGFTRSSRPHVKTSLHTFCLPRFCRLLLRLAGHPFPGAPAPHHRLTTSTLRGTSRTPRLPFLPERLSIRMVLAGYGLLFSPLFRDRSQKDYVKWSRTLRPRPNFFSHSALPFNLPKPPWALPCSPASRSTTQSFGNLPRSCQPRPSEDLGFA